MKKKGLNQSFLQDDQCAGLSPTIDYELRFGSCVVIVLDDPFCM